MMNEPHKNSEHFSLYDLFAIEVEAQSAILKPGLQKLALLDSAALPAELETLIRAAQLLQSAAYMAEAKTALDLAKGLEATLVALQKNEITLDDTRLDILARGIDRLASFSTETADAPGNEKDAALLAQLSPNTADTQEDSAPETIPETVDVEKNPEPEPRAQKTDAVETAEAEDCSMLELFSVEVEVQTGALTRGLLELEQDPGQTAHLEELMRAAHSIKGAARMVDVGAAVRVAHVMEDCFVAAQQAELNLNENHIDVLLKGVDMLSRIASEGSAAIPAETLDALVEQLNAVLHNQTPEPSPATTKTAAPAEKPPAITPPPAAGTNPISADKSEPPTTAGKPRAAKKSPADSAIRVSAENLNRLMGLAGEVQVISQGLQPLNDSLLHLKHHQAEVITLLDKLGNVVQGDDYVYGLLTDAQQKMSGCRELLTGQLSELDEYECQSQGLAKRLNSEVISSRMRPFMDGVQGFQRMVRDVARSLGKNVNFVIRGQNTPVDREILEKIEAPLNHLLRNALDHGIEDPAQRQQAGKPEQASLILEAQHSAGMLSISVKDDGRGIELEQLREKIIRKKLVSEKMAAEMMESELMEFLFLPGFSTRDEVTEISGRGVGLDVVHSVVQEMRGVVRAVSDPGRGMRFHMQLPLTLSVIRALLVEISGEPYAFPLARIEHTLKLPRDNIEVLEGRQYFTYGNQHVGLVSAHQILGLEASPAEEEEAAVIMLGERLNCYGVVVDRFLGERNLVVQPLDPRLGKIRDISAGAILNDGSSTLIIDVDDLLRSTDILVSGGRLNKISRSADAPEDEESGKRILVVDDSITVREVERGMLEARGYSVEVAVDGMDGWNAVRTGNYDLVISDIDMPRMNGFEFVGLIKKDAGLKSMPVMIVSYKDREEDRIRGLEAGADYYLTKGSFHDETLLDAVRDLIGEA